MPKIVDLVSSDLSNEFLTVIYVSCDEMPSLIEPLETWVGLGYAG